MIYITKAIDDTFNIKNKNKVISINGIIYEKEWGMKLLKKRYIIGGTMGVGKTTVCQKLKETLPNSVFSIGIYQREKFLN